VFSGGDANISAGLSRVSRRAVSSCSISSSAGSAHEELLTGFSRGNAARGAGQQAHIQPRFQITHRVAQRRLRNSNWAAARVKLRSRATTIKESRSLKLSFNITVTRFMNYIHGSFLLCSLMLTHLCATVSTTANEEYIMKIIRSGSLPSIPGPEAWFTGTVRIDAPFQATEPAKVGGATVTFEPGARTAWHTHPWDKR
jgi:hypothetical protein